MPETQAQYKARILRHVAGRERDHVYLFDLATQVTSFNSVANCDAKFFQVYWLANEIISAAAKC